MTPINNYNVYTNLMKNGFYDKLFFADKLISEWNSFLDFGCADGFLTRMIAEAFPQKKIFGYDEDAGMIASAQVNSDFGSEGFPGKHSNTKFYYDLNKLKSDIKLERDISALKGNPVPEEKPLIDVVFLSSLLHEVYSYSTPEQIQSFWKFIFDSGFKYVVIRDMMPDIDPTMQTPQALEENLLVFCERNNLTSKLSQFEKHFGNIENYRNCLHFMLKYKYVDNWEREVAENYFSLSVNDFKNLIPADYRIEHEEHFTLPFNKWQWENDFDFFVNEKIHTKFILRRVSDNKNFSDHTPKLKTYSQHGQHSWYTKHS
jgi:SAM-dependent methyltransferase